MCSEDGESSASPEKLAPRKFGVTEEQKKTGLIQVKETEPEEVQKQGSEEVKGANIVMNDQHRNTAIEIFENYFARAYKRKDNAPMNRKRFMKRIENARKREMFDDAYVRQF